jgi:hypothetical protein
LPYRKRRSGDRKMQMGSRKRVGSIGELGGGRWKLRREKRRKKWRRDGGRLLARAGLLDLP